MKQFLYVFSNMTISRKQNTICCQPYEGECSNYGDEEKSPFFISEREDYLAKETGILPGEKKYIPVETVEGIFSFGTIHFNSKFLYFLSRYSIPLYCFTHHGNFAGAFLPPKELLSGNLMILQVQRYAELRERMIIGRSLTVSALTNMRRSLVYYAGRKEMDAKPAETLKDLRRHAEDAGSVDELLGIEGTGKRLYYSMWETIFDRPFTFPARKKHPAPDPVNSLISYGNAILYAACLHEIYKTKLYPEIGFIHQPGDNRFSLALDLADVFKPVIVDRAIFSLINRKVISPEDFVCKDGSCMIGKDAKLAYITLLREKFDTPVEIRGEDKRMTYRRIIRNDCYKLAEHIETGKPFVPFTARW